MVHHVDLQFCLRKIPGNLFVGLITLWGSSQNGLLAQSAYEPQWQRQAASVPASQVTATGLRSPVSGRWEPVSDSEIQQVNAARSPTHAARFQSQPGSPPALSTMPPFPSSATSSTIADTAPSLPTLPPVYSSAPGATSNILPSRSPALPTLPSMSGGGASSTGPFGSTVTKAPSSGSPSTGSLSDVPLPSTSSSRGGGGYGGSGYGGSGYGGASPDQNDFPSFDYGSPNALRSNDPSAMPMPRQPLAAEMPSMRGSASQPQGAIPSDPYTSNQTVPVQPVGYQRGELRTQANSELGSQPSLPQSAPQRPTQNTSVGQPNFIPASSVATGAPFVSGPPRRGNYATRPYNPAVFQHAVYERVGPTVGGPPVTAASQTTPSSLASTTLPGSGAAGVPAQYASNPQAYGPVIYPTAYQQCAPDFPSTGVVGNYPPNATITPNMVPQLYTANNAGYRPFFSLGQENYNVSLGRGVIGQPTVYVAGQPVRNFLRYIFP